MNKNVVSLMRQILESVVDAVRVAGPLGAPSGVVYAALSSHGCSLSQYQEILRSLLSVGWLTQEGDLLFVGPQAPR